MATVGDRLLVRDKLNPEAAEVAAVMVIVIVIVGFPATADDGPLLERKKYVMYWKFFK